MVFNSCLTNMLFYNIKYHAAVLQKKKKNYWALLWCIVIRDYTTAIHPLLDQNKPMMISIVINNTFTRVFELIIHYRSATTSAVNKRDANYFVHINAFF